jgi:acetyl-CoA carboxylase biotin carboxyl carrier protein
VDLTNEDVADVLALLDSLPYDSLDLETSRFRLTLRRAPDGWTEESQVLTEPAVLAHAPDAVAAGTRSAGQPGTAPGTSAGPDAAAQADAAAAAGATAGDGLAAVMTPLPGTFYRAPRPGAEPFVQVGDTVTPDTVVAIVETMKLMNPVHAGTAGRVARIALENGDFAPLGTTLLLIEPA